MEPRYDIKEVEARVYAAWERSGFFNPDVCAEKGVTKLGAEPFSIVLPPPNVTGELHMGHAAMLAVEDILVRFERMRGRRVLWVPGTDHAAIATQARVEKGLYKTEKKTRYDLGREAFLRRVTDYAEKSHDFIVKQIKRMGASLDWSREAYTLDAARGRAVRTAFKRLYDMGLIYRGNRIVNWDPELQTTVSDDEVDWEERTEPFYYLKYGPFVIATARPETKFGDKYVVAHPEDKRYAKYRHGETLRLEWINGPVEATIIKDPSIDMEFGTGVMTITPSHDAADFDIALRHKLDMEQIIDLRGKLLPIAGEFAGMHIKKARPLIIEKLRAKGLLDHIDEKYVHRVATNSRGDGVIEPQILKQWFVAVDKPFGQKKWGFWPARTTLKKLMREAVAGGRIRIIPERFEKIYFHWIDNLRDWCISRQLWFGHRIPAWYRTGASKWNLKLYHPDTLAEIRTGRKHFETRAGKPEGAEKDWRLMRPGELITFTAVKPGSEETLPPPPVTKAIAATRHFSSIDDMLKKIPLAEIAPGLAIDQYKNRMRGYPGFQERLQKYGVWAIELTDAPEEIHVGAEPPEGAGWEQDPGTLDTWFSSGLWPFSTLGWPDDTPDLKTYFPNSVLETGYDIIFFWVARMILMSGALTGAAPFRRVYLHGLVRDAKGRKMSKSLGNGIDPLEMADKYGADATRLSLVIGAAAGSDIKLSEDRIRGYRNFSTKLWNIARFINMNKPAGFKTTDIDVPGRAGAAERKELAALKAEVTAHIEAFEFHLAAEKLYHYVWHTLADKIVEAEKKALRGGAAKQKKESYALLENLLLASLKMLHPFMPFVTEEIYGIFRPGKLLLVENW